MKIQRMSIIKLHAILACFFMPMALLYFLSGALYSFDIKGNVDKQVYTVALNRPFAPDLAQLSESVTMALVEHKLSLPKGNPVIRKRRGAYEYHWGDLKRTVVVQPTDDLLKVQLTYRQRSPLTQLMRVHRAEAGSLIKTLSLGMVVALIFILGSGVFLAVGMPKLRRTALLALGAGFVVILAIFV
jgi:PepSY-associated TM region